MYMYVYTLHGQYCCTARHTGGVPGGVHGGCSEHSGQRVPGAGEVSQWVMGCKRVKGGKRRRELAEEGG